MKRKFCLLTLMSIIFALNSSYANASKFGQGGLATFTPGAGYYFLSSKHHMEDVSVPNFALGYNFNDCWGIEGFLGFFNTDFKKNVNEHKEVSGTLFAVDAMYHFFPGQRVQPFLLAGVGIQGLSPNRYDANNEGNINAGVGVQIFADEIVALRLEARDVYTMVGGKNDVLLGGGVTFLLNWC